MAQQSPHHSSSVHGSSSSAENRQSSKFFLTAKASKGPEESNADHPYSSLECRSMPSSKFVSASSKFTSSRTSASSTSSADSLTSEVEKYRDHPTTLPRLYYQYQDSMEPSNKPAPHGNALLGVWANWSKYYTFNEKTCEVDMDQSTELKAFASAIHGSKSLQKVCSFSRAAVKIWVPVAVAAGSPLYVTLSGFCLEKSYFVACAHFLKDVSDPAQKKQLILDLMTLKWSLVASASVANALSSYKPEVDIAVFKMVKPAELPRDHHYVKIGQLHALTGDEQSRRLRAWVVAYAAPEIFRGSVVENIPDRVKNNWKTAEGPMSNYTIDRHQYLECLGSGALLYDLNECLLSGNSTIKTLIEHSSQLEKPRIDDIA
ncbi:MAG: hypothetical protein M1836_008149 [Candelina mexicana]|nr:MAG: hypothetical protein M1836_008149 [Candelina mexicana]